MGGVFTKVTWYRYGKKHFTKSGYEAAKEKWGTDILPTLNLSGKRYLVTGANSGLGKEVARYLASRDATVYMVCRNKERGDKAMTVTFATHLLFGTYGLSLLLAPMLSRCPEGEGRLVAVSSGGMYQTKLNTDDLQSADDYDGVAAYCKAKRATVDVMEQWAKRPPPNGTGVTYVSCHPGWADTPGVDAALPGFKKWVGDEFRSTWEGAEGIAWLCVAPKAQLSSGEFYLDRLVAPKHLPKVRTRVGADVADSLMDKLGKLAGLQPLSQSQGR